MKYAGYILKTIAAGLTGLIILSVLTCFYSLTPMHVPNKNQITDFVWPSDSYWVSLTEGIAWGKFDGDGFNNNRTISSPEILFMGSSHLEAQNVFRERNACSLLEKEFNGRYPVYNLGISGHNLFKVCHYVPRVLDHYRKKPPAFLLIETATIDVSDKMADDILHDRYRYKAVKVGRGVKFLMRLPFIRFLYLRWKKGLKTIFIPGARSNSVVGEAETSTANACDRLLRHLADTAAKHGVKIIICYHPREVLRTDGSLSFIGNGSAGLFAEAAARHGVTFIDMSSAFRDMFRREHHVPHGFINGKLGRGHLNRYGHEAIARELAAAIRGLNGVK